MKIFIKFSSLPTGSSLVLLWTKTMCAKSSILNFERTTGRCVVILGLGLACVSHPKHAEHLFVALATR